MYCIRRLYTILLCLVLLLVSFCSSSQNKKTADNSFPYDMEKPDVKYSLNESLTEISGMAWSGTDTIFCVQDEKARIYVFTLPAGKASKYLDFGNDGDFEDVATDGKNIYALRSDGRIYSMSYNTSELTETEKYKTPLSSRNNAEGLVWDKVSQGLLIACKGSPLLASDQGKDEGKAVYRFDPVKKSLDPKPFFIIDLKDAANYKSASTYNEFLTIKKIVDFRFPEFQPSAISIHPVTGQIYILSSTAKLILITDRSGKILNFSFLNSAIFRQPEGLCFSPEGDMYISSEGKGGRGYILKFKAKS